jgi:hypothetical protein
MENREIQQRRWPIAVTVSASLHGAALLGFSLISGRQAMDARTATAAPCLSFCVLEGDAGEVIFEGAPAPQSPSPPPPVKRPSAPEASAEPLTARLRETWGSGTEESEAGAIDTGSKPAALAGGPATSFFHVAARGQRIVYLVDGSATMGKKGALAAACRELHRSVSQLPSTARFQVIIYNHEPHYVLPASYRKWLEPTPATLSAFGAALSGKAAEGATDHALALREAFLLYPPADLVFFLTDADALAPQHLQLIRSLNRQRAVVNTIDLNNRHRGRADTPLEAMARENDGMYQAVDLGPD